MSEAIIYTILSIFAVYGFYSAAIEIVLFISKLLRKKQSDNTLCHSCKGCGMCEKNKEIHRDKTEDEPYTEEYDNDDDRDFFRT